MYMISYIHVCAIVCNKTCVLLTLLVSNYSVSPFDSHFLGVKGDLHSGYWDMEILLESMCM